jgi:hypothetical protein
MRELEVYRWRELAGFCKKHNAKVYADGNDAVGTVGYICTRGGKAFSCPEADRCPVLDDDFDVTWFEEVSP